MTNAREPINLPAGEIDHPRGGYEHVAMLPGRESLLRRAPALSGRARAGEAGHVGGSPGQMSPGIYDAIRRNSTPAVTRQGRAALVRVDGPVMNDVGWLYDSIECLTHGGVASVFDTLAADPSVATVVLDLSCPGWGVEGSSDTLAALARLRTAKRVVAYVHDMAASGGVWMAAYADEISISPSGWMGHIGSLIMAYDTSKAFALMGVEAVPIASDPNKACGYPGVALTPAWKANMQRVCDLHTADFFAAVASGRGLSVDSVRELAAGMFAAPDAVALKLADRVEAPDAFLARVAALGPKAADPSPVPPSPTPITPTNPAPSARKEIRMELKDATVADLRTHCPAIVASIEAAAAQKAEAAAAQKADAALAQQQQAPATYPQLKEHFGSDAQFMIDCMDKGLSLAQAQAAYTVKLRSDLAAATARAVELEQALATAKAATPAPTPTNTRKEGEEPLSAGEKGRGAPLAPGQKHPYLAKVDALMSDKKIDMAAAMAQVARAEPQLHAEYIASTQTPARKALAKQAANA